MATLADDLQVAAKCQQTGDLRRAEQLYRQALRVDANNANVWSRLAGVLEEMGNSRGSETRAERSTRAEHEYRQEAVAACQALLRLRPEDTDARRSKMSPQTWQKLDQKFAQFPIMRASEVPSEEEIADAARAIGHTFHGDYVAFLRRYGGAMVGSLPVFGLRPAKVMGKRWSVVEMTKWFREHGWPGANDWYVISEDGFGNPIGIARDGHVMISDHDVGKISMLATDFEDLLLSLSLKVTR